MLSKKEEKRLYDIKYRRNNKESIAKKKQAYCETPEGRAMQKRARDKRKGYHLEYCQTEKYREWKREYDLEHRNKKKYGEFWECMIIVTKIHKIVCEAIPDPYERRKMRGQVQRQISRQMMKRRSMVI